MKLKTGNGDKFLRPARQGAVWLAAALSVGVVGIDTPTGRKVRFLTNRKIAFGEAYHGSESKQYDLTAGEFDINLQDKSKSSGVLYPAAQLVLNADGELQMELRKNPWRLTGIIDWTNKGEK